VAVAVLTAEATLHLHGSPRPLLWTVVGFRARPGLRSRLQLLLLVLELAFGCAGPCRLVAVFISAAHASQLSRSGTAVLSQLDPTVRSSVLLSFVDQIALSILYVFQPALCTNAISSSQYALLNSQILKTQKYKKIVHLNLTGF
jgi:hypothetical protein